MKVLGVITLVVGLFFIMPIIGVVAGMFSGWVVSLFFNTTFMVMLAKIGIVGVELWQVGAFLGFVGGFFKSYATSKSD